MIPVTCARPSACQHDHTSVSMSACPSACPSACQHVRQHTLITSSIVMIPVTCLPSACQHKYTSVSMSASPSACPGIVSMSGDHLGIVDGGQAILLADQREVRPPLLWGVRFGGFGVWGLGFGVWGLGCRVVGFQVSGLGTRDSGLGDGPGRKSGGARRGEARPRPAASSGLRTC